MNVRHDDPRLRWHGAVSWERTDAWTRPWRLPFPKLALFPPERLQAQAGMPAGVRLAFRSDTRTLQGCLEPDPAAQNLDLVCGGDLIGTRNLSGRSGFSFEDLPAGDKTLELWLPQWGGFRLKGLEKGLERLRAWDEAVLRERARSDKHTARVLLPDPVTGEEETRLLYIRDVGLIVAGPGLTTRPNAIETPTQRKRRRDRMKGRLEPIVRFGMFEVFSERAWQEAKEV